MKLDDEQIRQQHRVASDSDGRQSADTPHHATQAEIDEEIAAMKERSRRQTHSIEPPPEIPPAPPRRALIVVGAALLILPAARAATFIPRARHERAPANDTDHSPTPTAAP